MAFPSPPDLNPPDQSKLTGWVGCKSVKAHLRDLTPEGCCMGSMLLLCNNNMPVVKNCQAIPKCGWDAVKKRYGYGTSGGADPSGKHPLSCLKFIPDCGCHDLPPPDVGPPKDLPALAECFGPPQKD